MSTTWLTPHLAGYTDLALYDVSQEEWGLTLSIPFKGMGN
jgi:hypothetical protein